MHNAMTIAIHFHIPVSSLSVQMAIISRAKLFLFQTGLSGSVIFSGLTPGLYVLKIHAYNRGTDAVVVKRAFMMTSDPNFCSVVLINRGVVVSENGREATIEVNSYGLANTYTCRLDNEPEFECELHEL